MIDKVTKRSGDMANVFDILQTERRYLQRLIFERFLKISKIAKIDRGSNSRPHTDAAVRDTTKSSRRHPWALKRPTKRRIARPHATHGCAPPRAPIRPKFESDPDSNPDISISGIKFQKVELYDSRYSSQLQAYRF